VNTPAPAALRRLLAAVALAVARGAAHADEIGINVYGLSYHFDRDRAQALGVDNEVNPGLGFRWQFAETERWRFFADAGVFNDSGRNTAVLAGAGALWHVAGGFQVGAALAVLNSDTYNDGRAFIAPLPLVAWDLGQVTLNATFFPKVERYNDVATLGFWVTLWPGRW
jgi:hypothetical protein